MRVAFADLVAAHQLFIILVFGTECAADRVDFILLWCRIVTPGRLVADRVSLIPSGIDVASRELRARLCMAADGSGYCVMAGLGLGEQAGVRTRAVARTAGALRVGKLSPLTREIG